MDAAAMRNALHTHCARGIVCLMLMLSLAGCGGMRESRRSNPGRTPISLGLAEPPPVDGSAVRSQDSSRPLRRLADKTRSRATASTRTTQVPQTHWSDPSGRDATPSNPAVAQTSKPALLPLDAAITAPRPAQAQGEIPTLEAPALEQPTSAQASAAPKASDDLTTVRNLINQSRARLNSFQNYQTQMTRQERVGASLLPVEEVVLSVRREPFAVRLEWPTGPNKGREALYSARDTEGKLQVLSPGSLVPRVSLDPSSPLVLRNSRHPITEAGLDNLVATIDKRLAALECGKGDGSTMTYKGLENVNELDRPCHLIIEKRPDGQIWVMALDSESMLPAMVRAQAADGNLLELYYFRNVRENLPELASADAFSPNVRWASKSSGLLGRIGQ